MFEPTGFSLKIFKDRYSFTENETWSEACERLSRQMIIPESPEKQKVYLTKFNEILADNLFVPGGRIWYNSGRHHPNLLNCFILSSELDSREGWGKIAKETIITSMYGGGVGTCFDDIRPRGSSINSQSDGCPGPLALMQLIDGCAEPIRSGGGRRVAFLFGLSSTHPDIIDFINSKRNNNKLTHANISVKINNTTELIKAIKQDKDYELSWKGRYKKNIKAKELWEKIVYNAYNFADPGVLNWELVESESTISYIKKLMISNPCGEQVMSDYESCCLGHLVLPRFIVNNQVDWHLLGNTIRTAVRFLDNVLSVNYYPLIEIKETSNKFRRIGLGTTGLADMLIILGYKYGSEEANKFLDKLYRFISKAAYESSIMLAIEKGAFPLCEPEKHIETGFVKRMPAKIKSLILENGIRNCAILTCAPTGTVSILSGNCSSGVEPIFSGAYNRKFWKGDKRETELVFHPLFAKFIKEGKPLDNFISARDLSVRDHLEVQSVIQRHVDSAVSKTINIPEDYPIEKMAEAWLEYLPYVKGTTFYRENTRGFINDKGELEEPPLTAISIDEAKKCFIDGTKEEIVVNDCATGVCSI